MNYREECLKTVAKIKHSEFLEQRLVYEEVVQYHPTYKGQKPYIPYLWNSFMKKERGISEPDHILFKVTDLDLLLFPELRKKKIIKLASSNGKVFEVK